MLSYLTRRNFLKLGRAGLLIPFYTPLSAAVDNHFSIRTITAGIRLQDLNDLGKVENAIAFLQQARESFQSVGYKVQTIRLATQPLQQYQPDWNGKATLNAFVQLQQLLQQNQVVCSVGPVITTDTYQKDFADWAVKMLNQAPNISFSINVASAQGGVHSEAVRTAAEAIHAIAHSTPGGEGNFNFAASAWVPTGTPFFPAAYFSEDQTFSLGFESPNLLTEVFKTKRNLRSAKQALHKAMNAAFQPVEAHAKTIQKLTGRRYLGADVSPAPGLHASIGKAIETLAGAPFGSPSTLSACAAITDVLKSLDIKTCGYSGLMLPVLEDPILAQRAAERRYGISELLLYSSVCGTGLDVVPIPGDTSKDALSAIITDVAALADKYQKPLSARLFPMPGKQAGDTVKFTNPFLTQTKVMSII